MNVNFKPIADNDELLKELTEQTELKPEPFSAPDFYNTLSDPDPAPISADFEPLPDAPHEPRPDPQPVINYRDQAKLLIAFVDGFQTLALPVAYQKTYFTAEELETLKEIKKIRQAGTPENEEHAELLTRYEDCQDLIDDLPFTDKEVHMLSGPLAAVMEKYKFTPGPETLLMGAVFTVMAPRMAPLLVNLR